MQACNLSCTVSPALQRGTNLDHMTLRLANQAGPKQGHVTELEIARRRGKHVSEEKHVVLIARYRQTLKFLSRCSNFINLRAVVIDARTYQFWSRKKIRFLRNNLNIFSVLSLPSILLCFGSSATGLQEQFNRSTGKLRSYENRLEKVDLLVIKDQVFDARSVAVVFNAWSDCIAQCVVQGSLKSNEGQASCIHRITKVVIVLQTPVVWFLRPELYFLLVFMHNPTQIRCIIIYHHMNWRASGRVKMLRRAHGLGMVAAPHWGSRYDN